MKHIDIFEIYKELYFHEIQMRESINSRIQIPAAIIVSNIGVLSYMLSNVTPTSADFYTAWILLMILNAILLSFSITYLIFAWHGSEYRFLPSSGATREYAKTLEKHYADYEDAENLTSNAIYNYLIDKYITCTDTNSKSNDNRSYNIHFSNRFLSLSLFLTLITFGCFHLGSLKKEFHDSTYKIELTNPSSAGNTK
ncbi:hypothetical protein SAMN04488518_103100 [Pseudovibrio ascidiaceicola]|uniref:SMODS and SLOG-associating 2TM effector domain-containing protein n=1 Tax=Pseudovibrio ascidiaceicola TaxID=285279 RepID=A0A1I3XSH0_9HYPH|nr:hypothetical protein [Pseudovibrio ascidiaceicola]SFK22001.1 hypothetical protein SAMN04488518_103100 [Pseudovibrio ascidiaceicola]